MAENLAENNARDVLERFSVARVAPYRSVTANEQAALELYRWNMAVAGELHQMLGLVEVTLRNAIDQQLRNWNRQQSDNHGSNYGENWVERPATPLWVILNPPNRSGGGRHSTYRTAFDRAKSDSDRRRSTHARWNHPITHDDIIAHITFGTWYGLLPYEKQGKLQPNPQRILWEQSLINAFPNHPHAPVIKNWVERLYQLRNRVAHLEFLVDLDIPGYHKTAARLLKAISPEVSDWYSGNTKLIEIWKLKP